MTAQEDFYKVEAYDLGAFLQGVEDAFKAGYELDLTRNETYPFGAIGHYIVMMVPKKESVETLKVTIDTEQVKEQVKKIQDKIDEAQAVGVTDVDVEIPEIKVETKKVGRKAKGE